MSNEIDLTGNVSFTSQACMEFLSKARCSLFSPVQTCQAFDCSCQVWFWVTDGIFVGSTKQQKLSGDCGNQILTN